MKNYSSLSDVGLTFADDGELTASGTALNLCLGCDGYGIVVTHVFKCGFDCFHTSIY